MAMNVSVLFNNIVGALLLPPLNFALLCGLGLLLRKRWPRAGLALVLGALGLLLVFSTNAGARLLQAPLERMSVPLADPVRARAEAIVVVGGGRLRTAPEYGGLDRLALVAHQRVHYAAMLQHRTGLPILTSGGRPADAAESEAEVMARILSEDYGVPVRWTENDSNNTAQNADRSAAILLPEERRRILLVTDAIHMPRARAAFERAGFEVVPAPTLFHTYGALDANDFIPTGEGLRRSHYAMHEWVGMLWYRLRY